MGVHSSNFKREGSILRVDKIYSIHEVQTEQNVLNFPEKYPVNHQKSTDNNCLLGALEWGYPTQTTKKSCKSINDRVSQSEQEYCYDK